MQAVPMSVDLPTDLAQFVHEAVASGNYASEREVVIRALRMLQHQEYVRREVQLGLDQLDQGLSVDGDEVFRRLRAEFVERRES